MRLSVVVGVYKYTPFLYAFFYSCTPVQQRKPQCLCGFALLLYTFPSQAVRARTEHAAGRAHWRADSNRDVSSLARGAALQACRLLAFRKAGKVPAKPPARTCMNGSIKRERKPPLRGAKRQPRHWAADALSPLDEARPSAAAPGRESTAEALRRGLASPATDYSAMTVTNRAFTSPPQRWPWGTVGLK